MRLPDVSSLRIILTIRLRCGKYNSTSSSILELGRRSFHNHPKFFNNVSKLQLVQTMLMHTANISIYAVLSH